MPGLVRDKIRAGHKNFSDAQGETTCLFCDINDFDNLVQVYSGKELIELLD